MDLANVGDLEWFLITSDTTLDGRPNLIYHFRWFPER